MGIIIASPDRITGRNIDSEGDDESAAGASKPHFPHHVQWLREDIENET
jgi:hypothetical protein